MSDDGLSLSQELIMETLSARVRLGENVWTFSRRPGMKAALDVLQAKGLLNYKSGPTGDWLAFLTPGGRSAWLDPNYVLPHEQAVQAAVEERLARIRVALDQAASPETPAGSGG